jgi:hypothetical protein
MGTPMYDIGDALNWVGKYISTEAAAAAAVSSHSGGGVGSE